MSKTLQYDVHLVHDKADRPRTERLVKRLREAGLRVRSDEWLRDPGDGFRLALEMGLRASRTLVLCLSPAPLGTDRPTLESIVALIRDPAHASRRLIPVLLADYRMPESLRGYRYVDYRVETDRALSRLIARCRPFKQEEQAQWSAADHDTQAHLPTGVKLARTLRGHSGWIGRIAWSPDGSVLASPSGDKTIRLWNTSTGACERILRGHRAAVYGVAIAPSGRLLASGSSDGTIGVWDPATGQLIRSLSGGHSEVGEVAFNRESDTLASGRADSTVAIWQPDTSNLLQTLEGHRSGVPSIAFHPTDPILASGGRDGALRFWHSASGHLVNAAEIGRTELWSIAFDPRGIHLAAGGRDGIIWLLNATNGDLLGMLEGHTSTVRCIAFSADGHVLASKDDSSVRLWSTESRVCIGIIPSASPTRDRNLFTGLAFHPQLPLLAAVDSDRGCAPERVIHLLELDLGALLHQEAEPSARYINAKVVLVGDTGVGKSGLGLVLTSQPFVATDSTPGRRVWTLGSREVAQEGRVTQTRETLLWDLAGQPGYRVIHQLHLNEVAVALVVFDARSETDPLAGVRHWERALRVAQQRQALRVPMKKFLISARNDRGGVSISEERLQTIVKEHGFDGYFKTSAKEGWQIAELRTAIEGAIEWDRLPEVSSSRLFAEIKSFLLEVKKTGRLLAPAGQLYEDFARQHKVPGAPAADLRDHFSTCSGRLENRDLIRRLTFGGYVLLQPELLDAYGSAMVNTAKEEPDGLGSLAEDAALEGRFFVPREQKIADAGQEQLLLHATVEELVRHDLALRENAEDGRYLVFPSQFNRDYEDAPEPRGKALAITFDGPVQSLYSTLAVRLGHSGAFATGRAEMWRNAAVFSAKAGGKCGLFLNEFAEGRGRLILFFPDEHSSAETRFHFEEFVLAHTRRRALEGTVELVRYFVCGDCSDPVPDSYVKRLREKGKLQFACPCGGTVSLAAPIERMHFPSKVKAMEDSADRQRDFDAFVVSAKGETRTESFQEWAGGAHATLAIVFTDIVGSTALGEEIRDEAMDEVRRTHFAQSRRLIDKFQGREIKTIGDSFMAAFKIASGALDYARALQVNTGHPGVRIRAGIHVGPMRVEEGDVFGGAVNFAARVVGAIKDAEIWLSERAKEDVDRLGASRHQALQWRRHDGVVMKGFPGTSTLWATAGQG